ncbi:MAG: hemolysin III family protein [Carboxylicivirga sp.]|jgi:hemolysin III|nr:hemolysin III family protein [Carboxylicivirga sp.]
MPLQPNTYSPLEEKINIYSHLCGIFLGIIALISLLVKSTSTLEYSVYIVYGACIIALFIASTLYHSEKNPARRLKLKVFDHCAIYLMIAGSYLPFLILGIANTWAYALLAGVWLLAIAGIVLKLFYTGRYKLLSTISYVLLGWIVVIAINPLINHLTTECLWWLSIGGFFYTLGAVLYQIKKIPLNHAIFHLFVLAGAYSHFHAIYWHL